MLPPVRTFCFDHSTVQNQTDAEQEIRRFEGRLTAESSLFELTLLEELTIYIGSVFRFCKAATRGKVTDNSKLLMVFAQVQSLQMNIFWNEIVISSN